MSLTRLIQFIRQFNSSTAGITVIEYGVMAGLITLAIFTACVFLGEVNLVTFTSLSDSIGTANKAT